MRIPDSGSVKTRAPGAKKNYIFDFLTLFLTLPLTFFVKKGKITEKHLISTEKRAKIARLAADEKEYRRATARQAFFRK